MIAKDFAPFSGVKSFAIMVEASLFHDRGGFGTGGSTKSFVIMVGAARGMAFS
jgi:hypothetical protein